MLTILMPICYLAGLLGFLYAIGRFIREKAQPTIFDPGYFPLNRVKFEYEELSEQYSPGDVNGRKILIVALMKRGMEAVEQVLRIRDEKPSLQQMVSAGVIGENLWNDLLKAEKNIELEMQFLMEESNLFKPNWSTTFLQEASGLYQQKLQLRAQAKAKENSDNGQHDM